MTNCPVSSVSIYIYNDGGGDAVENHNRSKIKNNQPINEKAATITQEMKVKL